MTVNKQQQGLRLYGLRLYGLRLHGLRCGKARSSGMALFQHVISSMNIVSDLPLHPFQPLHLLIRRLNLCMRKRTRGRDGRDVLLFPVVVVVMVVVFLF